MKQLARKLIRKWLGVDNEALRDELYRAFREAPVIKSIEQQGHDRRRNEAVAKNAREALRVCVNDLEVLYSNLEEDIHSEQFIDDIVKRIRDKQL